MRKQTWMAIALSLAIFSAGPALAQDDGEMAGESRHVVDEIGGGVFDLLILRTSGFSRYVIGSVANVVVYPIGFATGSQQDILESTTIEPAEDTFGRKLGDF